MYLNNGALLKNGEYRIEKVLAAGGFGITYLAMQVALGRKVAVKEFFMKDHCNRDSGNSYVSVPSVGSKELVERFKEKFLKEARLIASFDHSNIIRIHDVFEENGTAYYVMEYLEGESLSALVARCGAIDEQVALRYTRQVADALAEVHAGNLLHLDVKPANIMLNKKGEAVLIDFGISKHYDSVGSQTSSGPAGISEGYAPLEQYEAGALSSFTPATDVYSLGATLYFLVTGQRPPKAGDVMNDGLPALPSDISPEVRTAIEAAMQPRRKDRPQSVAEFLNLLVRTDNREHSSICKEERETIPSIENKTEYPKNNTPIAKPNKNSAAWVVAAVLLLLLIGGYFVLSVNDSSNDSNAPVVAVTEDAEKPNLEFITEPTTSVVNTDSIVEARLQAYQDSIDAANAAREAEEARIEQLRRDSIAAVEAELARIEQQRQDSISAIVAERERILSEQRQGKLVDLGLSVYWAGWNVGATSPEGYGNYYAWGETTTKGNYVESSYQYFNGSNYVNIGNNISGTRYDVARIQWGGNWRMPTKTEGEELVNLCTWTWTTYNKVNGYKVTGPNGNSIFLPATGAVEGSTIDSRGAMGFYWLGSLKVEMPIHAHCWCFGRNFYEYGNSNLFYGYSVRPVCDK